MPANPDYLPEGVLAWAEEHRELLDLVVSELLQSGTWPTTTKLTRDLARQGRPVHVDGILRGMPKPLGFVENQPGRIVLLLFGLRLTSEGQGLLDDYVALLGVARERFGGDDEPPVVSRSDLRGPKGPHRQALGEIVLREAPFLGSGAGGPEDVWTREVTNLIVPYWDAQTPDDYLRVRAGELAMSPHFGFATAPGPTPRNHEVAEPGDELRDVFISHASEDEDAIARPLADVLLDRGYTVWFDQYELVLGDSLTERIDEGLAQSKVGVVILSHEFFAKPWPRRELAGLTARLLGGERNVLVPVWHGLTKEDILEYSPPLADLLAGNSTDGVNKLADDVERVLARRVGTSRASSQQSPRPSAAGGTSPSPERFPMRDQQALGAVNFDLDMAALKIAVLELVRSDDTIALQYLFDEALQRAREAIKGNEIEGELSDLLDKLACLAATFLMSGQEQFFERVVSILTQIYSMPGHDGESESFLYSSQIDPGAPSPRVWLQVIERVYALGALAVRHDKWEAVRDLTVQRPKRIGNYERSWLPHALVMASRAGHLSERKGEQTVQISLLTLARNDIGRLECLRPDGVEPGDDELLSNVAQFDVLSNLVTMDGTRAGGERRAYPNFARFYQRRVAPTVERLLNEPEMRRVLFKGTDDALALALETVGTQAQANGWQYDGFEGWDRTRVADFIAANLPTGA